MLKTLFVTKDNNDSAQDFRHAVDNSGLTVIKKQSGMFNS